MCYKLCMCYSGVLDESVGLLDLISPEHIYVPTQMINTNDDKNMYIIKYTCISKSVTLYMYK